MNSEIQKLAKSSERRNIHRAEVQPCIITDTKRTPTSFIFISYCIGTSSKSREKSSASSKSSREKSLLKKQAKKKKAELLEYMVEF